MDSFLTTNLDQVPESLDSEGNNVGAEIFCLADDTDQVSSDTLLNDLVSDGFIEADCRNSLKNGNHRVNRRSSHSILGEKADKSAGNCRGGESFQVSVSFLEETLEG